MRLPSARGGEGECEAGPMDTDTGERERRSMLEALSARRERTQDEAQSAAGADDGQGQQGRRYDWLAPLWLALGVRVAVFLFGDYGVRLLRPSQFHGILGIWNQYDVVWYVHIAMHGYDFAPPNNLVDFFPLYPLVISPLGHLFAAFGMRNAYVAAAMLIAWACFIAACVFLYRIVADRFGHAVGMSSVLLFSVFPFSVFYGAGYTEAPFILTAVVAFYAIERKQWWLAAAVALLAGAIRPPGLIVGATVALAYALDWARTRHGWHWEVLWLALTPLGTLAYFAYCWIQFGDPLAYQKASERGWHGGHLQLTAIAAAVNLLRHPRGWLGGSTDFKTVLYGLYAFLFLVFLISLVWVFRMLGPHYAFFAFASMVSPIATFSTLASTGRYLSAIFPTFIVAAYYLRKRPTLQQVIVVASALFLAIFALAFLFTLMD